MKIGASTLAGIDSTLENTLEFIESLGLEYAELVHQFPTENPDIEVVQLQFNYVDYEDERVQSKLCYEVCVKHGKPVMVMEPVRGGALVNLPKEALELIPNGSPASYALRYAAGFPLVAMVLSGIVLVPRLAIYCSSPVARL